MRIRYNIVGPENVGIDPKVDPQRAINMYPHVDPVNKKSALLPSPGLRHQFTGDAGTSRAKFKHGNKMYSVEGDKVFFYDSALLRTSLATLTTSSGYVGIAANNNNEVIFVDGVAGYIWDTLATTWTQIVAPGFPSQPGDVAFLDGYFVVVQAVDVSNEFSASNLNDGTTWNTLLDFALFQSRPDTLTGVRSLKGRLFLFGAQNTEVWYDAGASDFPFRKINNETMEFGSAAVGSIQRGFGRIFWLAQDKSGASSVVMTTGGQPTRVSSDAIEYNIARLTNPSDADSKLYKENGHIFYELSFTTDDVTYVLDLDERAWHTKQELDGSRFRAKDHAFFNNKHFVGSYNDNDLYIFDNTYDFYGTASIKRIRIGEPIEAPNGDKIRLNKFELLIKSGIGTNFGNSEDPSIFLSIAYDNGIEFTRRVEAKAGKTGKRRHKVTWTNLGSGYSLVPQIEYYQEGDFLITGALIDYDILE